MYKRNPSALIEPDPLSHVPVKTVSVQKARNAVGNGHPVAYFDLMCDKSYGDQEYYRIKSSRRRHQALTYKYRPCGSED